MQSADLVSSDNKLTQALEVFQWRIQETAMQNMTALTRTSWSFFSVPLAASLTSYCHFWMFKFGNITAVLFFFLFLPLCSLF